VVSFTHRPLYPQRIRPWYPLDSRLGGPQSWSGRGGEEKNSQPPPGIETWNPDRTPRSPKWPLSRPSQISGNTYCTVEIVKVLVMYFSPSLLCLNTCFTTPSLCPSDICSDSVLTSMLHLKGQEMYERLIMALRMITESLNLSTKRNVKQTNKQTNKQNVYFKYQYTLSNKRCNVLLKPLVPLVVH
jgi:hypothetical protein